MKKVFCAFVCILVMAAVTMTVFAAASAEMTIEASKTAVYAGDTVSFTVKISAVEDCCSAGVMLNYDEAVFEFVSGSCSLRGTALASFSDGTGVFAYSSGTAVSGEIFTFQLKVKDGAAPGDYSISAKGSARNSDGAVPVTVNALGIAVDGSDTEETVREPDEQTTATTTASSVDIDETMSTEGTMPTEETVPSGSDHTVPIEGTEPTEATQPTEETASVDGDAPAQDDFPWWIVIVGAALVIGGVALVLLKKNNTVRR